MHKYKFVLILSMAIFMGACNFLEPAPPTSTPPPTSTHTPIPSNTPTIVPPTDTPIPSPTIPPDIWLDSNEYEITVQHPRSTEQLEWGTSNEITIPTDGLIGGLVFTVEEVSGLWGPDINRSVAPNNSILKSGTARNNPPGLYCVADYFPGYNPLSVCNILAPGSTQVAWIKPYFAGPKTEVGVAFSVGACSPRSCTAVLRITNIRLIYYTLPE